MSSSARCFRFVARRLWTRSDRATTPKSAPWPPHAAHPSPQTRGVDSGPAKQTRRRRRGGGGDEPQANKHDIVRVSIPRSVSPACRGRRRRLPPSTTTSAASSSSPCRFDCQAPPAHPPAVVNNGPVAPSLLLNATAPVPRVRHRCRLHMTKQLQSCRVNLPSQAQVAVVAYCQFLSRYFSCHVPLRHVMSFLLFQRCQVAAAAPAAAMSTKPPAGGRVWGYTAHVERSTHPSGMTRQAGTRMTTDAKRSPAASRRRSIPPRVGRQQHQLTTPAGFRRHLLATWTDATVECAMS